MDIPGRNEQQELVLNDIVEVDLSVVKDAINAAAGRANPTITFETKL